MTDYLATVKSQLLAYIVAMNPAYQVGRHHKFLCSLLDDALNGCGSRRLAVSMPPRHGKSEIISKWFPSFWLGRRPRDQVMCLSYSADLALEFGSQVRGIMSSPQYAAIFPDSVSCGRSSSGAKWNTISGGKYKAAGVGGSITGFGGNLIVIDDPVKNRATAHSPTFKHMIRTFFGSTLFTRLLPDCVIIIVMTRWTEDDIIGMVVNELEGWTHINLDAICETDNDPLQRKRGEALWPEWYDIKRLQEIKSTMFPQSDWDSLYQGRPVRAGGNLYTEAMFNFSEPSGSPVCTIASWDTAASTNNSACFSAGTLWRVYDSGEVVCVKAVSGRWEFMELMGEVLKLSADLVLIERASSGISLAQTLRRLRKGFNCEEVVPRGDRQLKAKSVIPMLTGEEDDGLRVLWNPNDMGVADCVNVMQKYPSGTTDDYVSSVVQMLLWLRENNYRTVVRGSVGMRLAMCD